MEVLEHCAYLIDALNTTAASARSFDPGGYGINREVDLRGKASLVMSHAGAHVG